MVNYIEIPKHIQKALDCLMVKGFYSYIVGGCVRDSVIGLIPNDWDICTSALPNEIITCFLDYKLIKTGIKHGTVCVIINNEQIEITSYRTESEYTDHRHPNKVSFTDSLTDDLARRDFTINSIAYNHKSGIVDPFGGVNDIKNKIIKTVGNPYDRFDEDSLRILRAVRFSSTLGFTIEHKTLTAMNSTFENIKYVSAERQLSELKKMLCGDCITEVLLTHKNIISFIIPEFEYCVDYELMSICLGKLNNDEKLRCSCFFSYLKADISSILTSLKFDNKTKKDILNVTSYPKTTQKLSQTDIKVLLNKIGIKAFVDLQKISSTHCISLKLKDNFSEENFQTLYKILREKQCFTLQDLSVNGNDLVDLGLKRDKNLSLILNTILNLVIEEKLPNNKNDIFQYVSTL